MTQKIVKRGMDQESASVVKNFERVWGAEEEYTRSSNAPSSSLDMRGTVRVRIQET